MQLAHTLGENGPEIEFLIVAAAMLVLGIVFFLQKSVKPVVSIVLVLGALALGIGAFAFGGSDDTGAGCTPESSGDVALEIVRPTEGEAVPADEPVTVELELQGETSEQGHYDVRVDGELETMTPDPSPQITFSPGEHELQVEYVNMQHQSFDPPVIACVTIAAQ